jgi:hypothetical protein
MIIRKKFVHVYSQKEYDSIAIRDAGKSHLIMSTKLVEPALKTIGDELLQDEILVTPYTHVLVAHKPKHPDAYLHTSSVWTMVVLPDVNVEVFKNGKVILFGNAAATLYNMSSAICFDESFVTALDFSRCFALDSSQVSCENYSTAYLFDSAKVMDSKPKKKDNPNINPTIICCGHVHLSPKPSQKSIMCLDPYLIQEMKLMFESNRKIKSHISLLPEEDYIKALKK